MFTFHCLKSSGSGEHRQSGYFTSKNWQGVRSQSFELVFFFSLGFKCFTSTLKFPVSATFLDVCNIIRNIKEERVSVCGCVPEKFADIYGYFSSSDFSSGDRTQPGDLSFHGLDLILNHQSCDYVACLISLSLSQHSHSACPRPYSSSFQKRLLPDFSSVLTFIFLKSFLICPCHFLSM